MSVECFLDTNVLVYSMASDGIEKRQRSIALRLIEETDFGLSAQVLQELYVTLTRKIAGPVEPAQAHALIEQLRIFPTVWTDYPLIVAAIEHSLRHQISYRDGAILAAAEALDAPILYSEDLSHGQMYGSVRVVNPFV